MMSIRCAVCGSKRVSTEVKKEGYNQNRGAIGIALFGLKGSVAGVNNKEITYYHCADCGHTINYCMNRANVNIIEQALERKSIYDIDTLKKYKSKYPNIEWTEADKFITKYLVRETDCIQEMIYNIISQTSNGITIAELQNIEQLSEYSDTQLMEILYCMVDKEFLIIEEQGNFAEIFTIKENSKVPTKNDFLSEKEIILKELEKKLDIKYQENDVNEIRNKYVSIFVKKANGINRLSRVNIIYDIYIILKINNCFSENYGKVFEIYEILQNSDTNKKEYQDIMLDCFFKDIENVEKISLQNVKMVSNNAEEDFKQIKMFVEHEKERKFRNE